MLLAGHTATGQHERPTSRRDDANGLLDHLFRYQWAFFATRPWISTIVVRLRLDDMPLIFRRTVQDVRTGLRERSPRSDPNGRGGILRPFDDDITSSRRTDEWLLLQRLLVEFVVWCRVAGDQEQGRAGPYRLGERGRSIRQARPLRYGRNTESSRTTGVPMCHHDCARLVDS